MRRLRQSDIPACAGLLAARHKRDRARNPILPAAYESPEQTRTFIEAAIFERHGRGVVAVRDGIVSGYLIGTTVQEPVTSMGSQYTAERGLTIGYPNHALAADLDPQAYRQLYGALSEEFVRAGYFDHTVMVAPSDVAALEVWNNLGFGREAVAAIKKVGPVQAATEVRIRQATVADIDEVERLDEQLERHHAKSPIYLPYRWEARDSFRQTAERLLSDEANAYFLAVENDRAIGMNSLIMDGFLNPMHRPESFFYLFQGIVAEEARGRGIGQALLANSMEWGMERGYAYCGLHFFSANYTGADFWLGNGFEPVEYRLARRLDRRIIWQDPAPVDGDA